MFRPPLETDAAAVFEALLRRGLIVRGLKSYGLPELLRVSIGNDEENAMFTAALKDIRENGF